MLNEWRIFFFSFTVLGLEYCTFEGLASLFFCILCCLEVVKSGIFGSGKVEG